MADSVALAGSAPLDARPGGMSFALQALLGLACGLLIANVYYAQPLTGLIASAIGLPLASAGLLVTLPLAGYGLGLLTIVPLADLVENKRLVLAMIAIEGVCLAWISVSAHAPSYLLAAFLLGASASAVQVLVPYVSFFAPEAERGRALGRVVSGVMLGIMLARPVSGFLSDLWSWRVVFGLSAGLMLALLVPIALALASRRPAPGLTYVALLSSLAGILTSEPLLRRRAAYHACLFGSFSVFWTAVPLWLSGPQFGLSQTSIAWVALAGVAGAIAPPIAGRLADRGLTKPGTAIAIGLAAIAFVSTVFARGGSGADIAVVVASAIALDFAVSAHLVLSQRAIYSLSVAQRGRINGLFMAIFFAGGALGSGLGGWCYARFGWTGVAVVGVALPVIAFLYFLTEPARTGRATTA